MKFEGVLVLPLEKQHDRDDYLIDPAGVHFDPDKDVTIFRDFDYTVPDAVLGSGRLYRGEDGSIMVRGELLDSVASWLRAPDTNDPRAKLAIGIQTREGQTELHKGKPGVVTECDLMSVAMTWDHKDEGQPVIRLTEEES